MQVAATSASVVALVTFLAVSFASPSIAAATAGNMLGKAGKVGGASRSLLPALPRLAFSSAWVHPKTGGSAGSFSAVTRGGLHEDK